MQSSNSFTFSLYGSTGPIQSLSCNVRLSACLSVCHTTFCIFFKRHITPVYKCCKSDRSIAKNIREKLSKDICLIFCNFGSERVKNHCASLSALKLVQNLKLFFFILKIWIQEVKKQFNQYPEFLGFLRISATIRTPREIQ